MIHKQCLPISFSRLYPQDGRILIKDCSVPTPLWTTDLVPLQDIGIGALVLHDWSFKVGWGGLLFVMHLLAWNSLIMFDFVFVFFLFLVGVTCLVYYLPGRRPVDNEDNKPLQCYVTVSSAEVQTSPIDHVWKSQ